MVDFYWRTGNFYCFYWNQLTCQVSVLYMYIYNIYIYIYIYIWDPNFVITVPADVLVSKPSADTVLNEIRCFFPSSSGYQELCIVNVIQNSQGNIEKSCSTSRIKTYIKICFQKENIATQLLLAKPVSANFINIHMSNCPWGELLSKD